VRHELTMAISAVERRLGDERVELTSITDRSGRAATTAARERPMRRLNLNMYHATTGAC